MKFVPKLLFSFSFVLVFSLACSSKNFQEPGVVSTASKSIARTYDQSYGAVWESALLLLQDKKIPIASSQREAGTIQTDWVMSKSDRLFSGYGETRIPYTIRYRFSIQVRPSQKGVRVQVDNEEQYYSDAVTAGTDFSGTLYQWIPTESSTLKENDFLADLASRLQPPTPSP